jgi:homoserine O-acetyltransferase
MESGEILENATLAYGVVGSLNASRTNVVVMPTYYSGTHASYRPLIGLGKALDPRRYCLVIPNLMGNGVSTSPSNTSQTHFPLVSVRDNVMIQGRLVFEHLGAREVALVCGWSLGGMHTYQWGISFPDRVRRLLPYGAAARTCPYNFAFLSGLRAVLEATASNATSERAGLKAFARVYAGWAYSHDFFHHGLYQQLGMGSVEDLMVSWERDHLDHQPRDLLAVLRTWQSADVLGTPQRRFEDVLSSIRAKTLLVGCATDRYFPSDDLRHEARFIPDCDCRILNSPFGHCAFSPGKIPASTQYLERCLRELLSS